MAAQLINLDQATLSCVVNGGYTHLWIAEKKVYHCNYIVSRGDYQLHDDHYW